jgi:hypothetical protein
MNSGEQSIPGLTTNEVVLTPFVEAYNNFMASLQPAWASPEVQQNGQETQQAYQEALTEAMKPDEQQRLAETWQAHVQVVQEALANSEMHERAIEAYRAYLVEMQQAWTQLNIDELDAPTLMVIGQSLNAAGWTAAAVEGKAHMLGQAADVPTP